MVEEPEVQETENVPQKKKKLVFLIVVAVAVLLLGGAGFFAYTKMMAPPPPAADGHGGAEEKHAAAPENVIYGLQPFVVNLADPKGKRYLKVKIELEVTSKEAVGRLEKLDAKLRDSVIMLLTSLTFEDVMTPEGKLRIRDELLDRFNQTVKPERINSIYFSEFVVQ